MEKETPLKQSILGLSKFQIVKVEEVIVPSRSLTARLKSYLANWNVVFQPPIFRGELLNFR